MLKQVIILRKDLNMRKGKMVSQGAHGSVGSALSCGKEVLDEWLNTGQTKITVGCDSLTELTELLNKTIEAKLLFFLVSDEGRTEFKGQNTITALVIGPCKGEEIDPITQHLKLL